MLFDLVSALLIAGSPVACYGGGVLLAEHHATYTTPTCNLSTTTEGSRRALDRDLAWRWGPNQPPVAEVIPLVDRWGYPDMKARPGKHLPGTGSAEFSRD